MNRRRGITLIELMVVVVIVGLIAAIASVKIIPHRKEEVRVKAAKAEMDTISISLEMYRSDIGCFPETDYHLRALIENPFPVGSNDFDKWNGPYIKYRRFVVKGCGCFRQETIYPTDPWGNEYGYQKNADGSCDIVSYGKDGVSGGTGWDEDIVRTCIK